MRHDVFFVGRGIDYAVCLEGSLKLKEISYIHSEAYAAGELKHGTISLIEQGTLVIGALTQSELYEKTISNMLECKSRGAYLMGMTTYGNYEIEDQVNFTVYVPKMDEHFVGSLAVIPLQLLGYYVSIAKGLDVDKPRNLAKSVTVEYIMAAGIGSRFGTGIKQLEPVDDAGHIIMDYSIYDAIEAGFNHVVFIIRKDIEKEFKEVIGDRIASICSSHNVTVDYAFQDINDIPGTLPEGRTKAVGNRSGRACCKKVLDTPFIVINADDYYGKGGF